MIKIGNYTLEGGGACPEQYDVFDQKESRVGYIRLRHGKLRAEYLDKIVYAAQPNGDGIFDEDERDFYLKKCIDAIDASTKLKL